MFRILITGASSRIGKALAINLRQKGRTLGLAARRLGKLQEEANLVEKAGEKTQIYPPDVRDRKSRMDVSDKVQFVAQPISLGLYAYSKNYPKSSLNLHPQLSRIHGLELAGDYLQGASIKA